MFVIKTKKGTVCVRYKDCARYRWCSLLSLSKVPPVFVVKSKQGAICVRYKD